MAVKNNKMLAFEGAQGFGAYTQGGRGGEVVKVTNLNDSGKGSLRWALEDLDHPRIVVFDVGGTIDLREEIKINGNVTVAGQTAPGGVTVTGARLRVVESEVIIRGLHVRPGDDRDGSKPEDRDGISVGISGKEIKNVIVDSNSITWSVDEVLATWGKNSNITFSNNIVGEALRDSIHPKGEHSKGLLIGDGSSQVSVIGNLLTSNNFRNALVKDDSHQIEFINNVVNNYGHKGFTVRGEASAHVINNVFIAGKDSTGNAPIGLEAIKGNAKFFISGNVGDVAGTKGVQSKQVFQGATTDILKTGDVLKFVLANVGANAANRDAIDKRLIAEVKNGSAEIIDSLKEVGGQLNLKKQAGLTDTDNDGIPDAYEAKIGSNAKVADANKDADGDGYSNIDNYINGLIDGFGSGGSNGPVQKIQQQVKAAPQPVEKPVKVVKKEAVVDTTAKDVATKPAVEKAAAAPVKASQQATDDADDFGPLQLDKFSADTMIMASWAEIQRVELAFKGAGNPAAATKAAPAQAINDDPIRVEAEDFDLSGFSVKALKAAENGKIIQRQGNAEHQADVDFDGQSGTYDILINYFDESDGKSKLAVEVNGKEIDDWVWNAKNGNALANASTFETYVIEDVRLNKGDVVSLVGEDRGSEPLRIDAVEFVPDDAFLI